MSKKPQQGGMQLQNFSIEQLKGLKDQADSELQQLGRALEGVRGARGRYGDSKFALEQYKSYATGQTILVPLTSSLYVSGDLKDTSAVLVDVGTGYFIKQSIPRAQEYFVKRMEQMKHHMDVIGDAINGKRRYQNAIIDVIQQKAQALQAAESSATQ